MQSSAVASVTQSIAGSILVFLLVFFPEKYAIYLLFATMEWVSLAGPEFGHRNAKGQEG
jgi:hypothetical protein